MILEVLEDRLLSPLTGDTDDVLIEVRAHLRRDGARRLVFPVFVEFQHLRSSRDFEIVEPLSDVLDGALRRRDRMQR